MTNPSAQQKVLLVRASGNEGDARALAELGIATVSDPYLTVKAVPGTAGYAAATDLLVKLTTLGQGDWVVITSANGLRHWAHLYGEANLATALVAAEHRGVRFAAVGSASAAMYSTLGINDVLIAEQPNGVALAAQLIAVAGDGAHTALVPTGNLAMANLSDRLTAAGWEVFSRVVYETATVTPAPQSVAGLNAGHFGAVLLRSPSAASALVEHAGKTLVPVITGGSTTAAAAHALGLNVIAVSENPEPAATARVVSEALSEISKEPKHVSN